MSELVAAGVDLAIERRAKLLETISWINEHRIDQNFLIELLYWCHAKNPSVTIVCFQYLESRIGKVEIANIKLGANKIRLLKMKGSLGVPDLISEFIDSCNAATPERV